VAGKGDREATYKFLAVEKQKISLLAFFVQKCTLFGENSRAKLKFCLLWLRIVCLYPVAVLAHTIWKGARKREPITEVWGRVLPGLKPPLNSYRPTK